MSRAEYLGDPEEVPGRNERPRPAVIREWRFAEWLAVGAVCFGAMTSQIDNGVITVSYPTLVKSLHRPLSEIAWIGLLPFVTVVATLLLFGRRADTQGRKRVYVDGLAIFVVGAVGSFLLAGNFAALLGCRVIEALGIAMVQANSVALVTSSVKPHQRTAALGIQAAAQAIGLAVGPLAGGLLAGHLPWRALFLVSAPMGVLALVASTLFLPRSRGLAPKEPLDVLGSSVLAVAASGLLGGLTLVAKIGWSGPTLGIVATGIAASIALFPVERRAEVPLFHPRLFRVPTVQRSVILLVLTYVSFFGLLVVIPFYATRNFGASVARSSEVIMAIPIGLASVAPLSGRLRERFADHALLRFAMGVVLLSLVGITAAPNGKVVAVLLFTTGVAIGIGNTTNNAAVMEGVADTDRGLASGTLNLARNAGSAVGMALATSVIVILDGHRATSVRFAIAILLVPGLLAQALTLVRPRAATT